MYWRALSCKRTQLSRTIHLVVLITDPDRTIMAVWHTTFILSRYSVQSQTRAYFVDLMYRIVAI